jgi:hypothetical protein
MTQMLAGVCAGTVALVLLAAFAGHVRAPRALPAALTAHRTVRAPLVWPIAVLAVALEGVLGVDIGYAVLTGQGRTLTLAAGAAAILLAGYAAYSLLVMRTRPGVPCGCSSGRGGDAPMTGWVAVRATALALASLGAAAGAGSAADSHGAHIAITLLASAGFAVLLWTLPLAMFDPARSPAS